jgi:hypothetical protein
MALNRIIEPIGRSLNHEAATAESAEITYLKQPLPQYDNSVKLLDIDTFESGSGNYGAWQKEVWEMEDGTRYKVCRIEPACRKTNVALASGTPWGTQIEGFNMHSAIEASRLGIPQIIIGPEMNASIPLSLSAYNQLQILNHIERSGFSEPKVSILKGFSRQAMIIFGMLAYAPNDERSVLYADSTDPCLAVSLHDMIHELGVKDYVHALRYGAEEVVGSLYLIARVLSDPRRRRYYHRTIDMSIAGGTQFVRTGVPLFSGEAGELALHVPRDTYMNIGFLLTSLANQASHFKDRLRYHPNVTYTDYEGVHTHGARRKIMDDTSKRLSGLVFQLARGVNHDELDYSLVHQPGDTTV